VSDIAVSWWSLVLSGTNLLVFGLTGRPSRRVRTAGWAFAIVTEPLWAYFGYRTGGWAFVVLAVFYVAVAAVNLRGLQPAEGTA
jgi:hypothetical protein